MATDATPVIHFRPADPAESVEFDAFLRLLPELRAGFGGRYVAIHGGRVIASGDFLDPVVRQGRELAGGAAVYYGWVDPADGYVFQSGRFEIDPA